MAGDVAEVQSKPDAMEARSTVAAYNHPKHHRAVAAVRSSGPLSEQACSFAIRVGLVTGLVTGIGVTLNPYIEYYADQPPEKRLGPSGIALILCGFALQSLRNWLALLDVRLR